MTRCCEVIEMGLQSSAEASRGRSDYIQLNPFLDLNLSPGAEDRVITLTPTSERHSVAGSDVDSV